MKGQLLQVDEPSRLKSRIIICRSQVYRGCAAGSILSVVSLGCVFFLERHGGNTLTFDVTFSAKLVQTSNMTGDRLAEKPDVPFTDDFPFTGPVVDVGDVVDGHELIGFGGAFTEACAVVYNQMPKNLQQKFIDLYFGEGGLDYSLGRTPPLVT